LPLLSASTSPEFGSSGQAAQEMFVFFSHLFSRCVLLSSFVSLFCFFIVLWDLPDPRLHQREQGFLKLRDRLISLALFISLRNPWDDGSAKRSSLLCSNTWIERFLLP
jgi:hypothetical protein